MLEELNRKVQINKVSPYVGYDFSPEPSAHNGTSCIYAPALDNPDYYPEITKMRGNLYCLEHPTVFNEAKEGTFKLQHNNTFVLTKSREGKFGKKYSGVK